MPNVVVAENRLVFGGVSYFRGHAEEVEIGSIGKKRMSLIKPNYLEVKDRILVPGIDVVKATTVEIDFNRTSKRAFNTAVSTIVKGLPVKFEGDTAFDKLRKGDLKLVKFSVLNNDMKKAANNSPEKLQDLIEWGARARIVHQVFIVVQASLAKKFDKKVNVHLSLGVKGLEAKLGGSGSASGTTSVQISKGTCFAYLMLKIKWNARVKRKKTKVVDLNDDQWGMG